MFICSQGTIIYIQTRIQNGKSVRAKSHYKVPEMLMFSVKVSRCGRRDCSLHCLFAVSQLGLASKTLQKLLDFAANQGLSLSRFPDWM
jgi:hypothetical protein